MENTTDMMADKTNMMENENMMDNQSEMVDNSIDNIEDKKKKFSPIIKVELTENQEKKIIELIASEHTEILKEYEEWCLGKGWINHTEETDRLLQNAKNPTPSDDTDSHKEFGLAQIASDVVASKDKRQTMGATPVITLEQNDEIENISDLRDREDRLDFILRKECKMEELNYKAVPYVCMNGAATIKIPYERKTKAVTRKVLYKPTPESISEFEKIYGGAEIATPGSKANLNYEKLVNGEEVEIIDIEFKVIKNGVYPYFVEPKNFFARLSKENFCDHKVISEIMDNKSFADIEACVTDDDFGYSQEAVDRLRIKIGTDEKTISAWKGLIYESIVNIKLESALKDGETKKKDYVQTYLVTFEDVHKTVLRCIHYPYEHGQPCYVALSVAPVPGTWIGRNFVNRDADMEEFCNAMMNNLLKEFQLFENGLVLTDDNKTEFGRITVNNGDGVSVLRFSPGSKFQQFQWANPMLNRVDLMNFGTNWAALKTGVDPAIQSGAESPSDPSAPYAKSALKQANSNMRIEDIILNLQKGYQAIAEQVESVNHQFTDTDTENGISYYNQGKKKEVNPAIYKKNVRFVCQGSRLSFDKNADSAGIMGFSGAFAKLSPESMQDIDVVYYLSSVLANNTGGSVERGKEIILKPLKLQSEAKKAIAEHNKQRKEAFWAAGKQAGADDQQIQAKWDEIQAIEKKGSQPPPQPQEMPVPQIPGQMPEGMPQ
jgi:hypothetical protein